MSICDLNGKRVAVLGVGISNRPLVKLLMSAGAELSLFDRKAEALYTYDCQKFSGDNYLDSLPNIGAEFIFRSPGVKPFEPKIDTAVSAGATLTSEMEVFFDMCPCPIYAVTGSDGKTTTTSILALLLEGAGLKVFKGGNIGTPLLDKFGEMKPGDAVVVELSSFQLMTMKKSPRTAVITNLSPNHLDWHRSLEEYIDAKVNIARFQRENARLIMNFDNDLSRKTAENYGLNPEWFTKSRLTLNPADIKIRGEHNLENFLAAVAAAGDLVTPEIVRSVARGFNGVPHRMELVAEIGGAAYYNDSIATSPTRTIAGLKTFERKVLLIAGGKPKMPFDELAAVVGDYAKVVLAFGASQDEIARAFAGKVDVISCGTVENAACKARDLATRGDAIVLSPACTSFDQFRNFEERGDLFKKTVKEFENVG
ncbi:UDP-N-acetylmuramoylalanine--D-glutamate ligase [Clostridia bacterium]|nr:UDP-N-acetylmuramoylalanine--D-glutamate ligase [Clostridia bacterium]